VEVSTETVKSVTLQYDGEINSVKFTSLYRHSECQNFVSELSGDSMNSAVQMVKSIMVNPQCSAHLVIYGLVTKMCDILKPKQPGGCKKWALPNKV